MPLRSAAQRPAPGCGRLLKLTKIVLLVVVVAIALSGRRPAAWPLAGWTMFSQLRPSMPASTAAAEELRVISTAGGVQRLSARDLWGIERHPVAARTIGHAFEHPDASTRATYRAYLAHLVGVALPRTEIKAIERWRLVWRVEPLAVPPLDRDRPLEAVLLGRLDATELGRSAR